MHRRVVCLIVDSVDVFDRIIHFFSATAAVWSEKKKFLHMKIVFHIKYAIVEKNVFLPHLPLLLRSEHKIYGCLCNVIKHIAHTERSIMMKIVHEIKEGLISLHICMHSSQSSKSGEMSAAQSEKMKNWMWKNRAESSRAQASGNKNRNEIEFLLFSFIHPVNNDNFKTSTRRWLFFRLNYNYCFENRKTLTLSSLLLRIFDDLDIFHFGTSRLEWWWEGGQDKWFINDSN